MPTVTGALLWGAGPALQRMHFRTLSLLSVTLLAALSLFVAAPPASAAEVRDVPDVTPQTDGVVFAVLPVGDRIYIAGDFTQVDGVPRNRLAAIDAATGNLTSWNPNANGRVMALAASPDGTRIYAGGGFTTIGGASYSRLVSLSAATGAVNTQFKIGIGSTVRAIAVSGNRVYIGGDFTSVKGQPRSRLALLDGTTAALDPNWAPAADARVKALTFSPDGGRLYAGGDFTSVSGQSRNRLAALDPDTGAVDAWRTLVNPNGSVFAIAVSGSRVYSAEGGAGGAASSYDSGTGARAWRLRGDGDGQAITVMGSTVYIGGHFLAFDGQQRPFFAAANATTGALDSWTPGSAGGGVLSSAYTTGVWALAADASRTRIYAGTNFRQVSGRTQAGFVQFSR